MKHHVLEIAEVTIKTGVSHADFMVAAQKVHDEFLSKQPGYVRHESYTSPEGRWVDLVYWVSEVEANKASEAVTKSELCLRWFAMMDEKSISMRHLNLVKRWS